MAGQLICENLRNLRIIKKHPQITQIKKKEQFMCCDFIEFHHPIIIIRIIYT